MEQFEIVETLDSYTCEHCAEMDSRVFDMKDFEVGVTAPPFHPWCRGTTAPYYDDWEEFGIDPTRVARDENGNTTEVEKMSYKEWKEKYVTKEFTIDEKYSQNYRKIVRGEAAEFKSDDQKIIKAHRIQSYKSQVYVSDEVTIKPKALNTINQKTEEALRVYGISPDKKPTIVITSPKELFPASGRYDPATNTVYYTPNIANRNFVRTLGRCEYHEMWHLKQAEEFRAEGWNITEENKDQFMQALNSKCKKKLDNAGVNKYNADEISEYADYSFAAESYLDIDAEINSLKALRGD